MGVPATAKKAVVLSGGGAYGAYEVGVLKALASGQSPGTNHLPLDPEVVTGTSVGAYNASFLVSQSETDFNSAVFQLQSIWTELIAESGKNCGNGVYRIRGSPLDFLEPQCLINHPWEPVGRFTADSLFFAQDFLRRAGHFATSPAPFALKTLELVNVADLFSVEPLKTTIRQTINLAAIRQSAKALRVITTNWTIGSPLIVDNAQMSDELGDQFILGSTALPGIFPPVNIQGQWFVDGGVLMNTPLLPAIRAGASVIHVIYIDPDPSQIPVERLQNTLDTFDRLFTVQWAYKANSDIETVRRINIGLDILERLVRDENGSEPHLLNFFHVLSRFHDRIQRGGPAYQKIEIHRYHPRDELGGPLGMLNFQEDRIKVLIGRGFSDAVHHDCVASGCVLPV